MSFEIAVDKKFGQFQLSLSFASASPITALFGPSGAGKTSVLNMVAGVVRPDQGRIAIEGAVLFDSTTRVNTPPERRRAGYIFQDGRLFPHLTVRQNLLYGFQLRTPEEHIFGLDETVEFLGIGALLGRWPSTLSGGEAQRVSIGRAVLSGPRFLLMDEPLSSLDEERKDEIIGIIQRLRDELRLPILYVSHDRSEVERLGAHVIPLKLAKS